MTSINARPIMRRTVIGAVSSILVTRIAVAQPTSALQWPLRPVRVLVGFAPGGFSDLGARALAQALTAHYGQSFVVENRSGASGTIATDLAAKAPADGYTLIFGHSTPNAVAAAVFKDLPYDPVRDLAPIAQVATHAHMLVVPPGSPYRSVAELVAAAKAAPGTVTYASAGIGSVHHMASELFASAAGIELLHVPYRGSAPAMADMLAGRVAMIVDGVGSVGPYVAEGRLRALAAGSAERIERLPDLPTLRELGYGEIDAVSWVGLFAPAGVPEPIASSLASATDAAVKTPTLLKVISDSGAKPAFRGTEAFRDFVAAEVGRYRAVIGTGQVPLQ